MAILLWTVSVCSCWLPLCQAAFARTPCKPTDVALAQGLRVGSYMGGATDRVVHRECYLDSYKDSPAGRMKRIGKALTRLDAGVEAAGVSAT